MTYVPNQKRFSANTKRNFHLSISVFSEILKKYIAMLITWDHILTRIKLLKE